MAFDENYHFGLIQLHAQQWLPYFNSQPENANVYGALARDPSYLYHWLLSFPYRLLVHLTPNQTVQIVGLRLINAALFVWGLVLYRRVLREAGASRAIANFTLALFVMIPIVPFLAAHINYDNLFFVVLAYAALLTFRILRSTNEKKLDAPQVLGLLTVLVAGCIVKYTFLPVAVTTGLFLLYHMWRQRLLSRRGLSDAKPSFLRLGTVHKILLVAACLVAVFLFAERYLPNLVQYHNPIPACDDVISQEECMAYGPYGRDQIFAATKPVSFHANAVGYLWQWLYGLWYRLYFAVNFDYATAPPLLLLSRVGALIAVFCAIGIVIRFRALFADNPRRTYLLWITAVYAVVLFMNGFQGYAKTGQPVAINGRYLLPFLPFVLAFGAMAWSQLFGRRVIKYPLAILLIVFTLFQGGGAETFLLRSHDEWFWDNATIRRANKDARSLVWYTVPYKDSFTKSY
jgi:hypothetical protein